MKKHLTMPLLIAVGMLSVAACETTDSAGTGTKPTPTKPVVSHSATKASKAPAKPKPSASKKVDSQDEYADVKVTGKGKPDSSGIAAYIPLTVTNHSSKRSNYIITLSIESKDGSQQLGQAMVAVNNVAPGASRPGRAMSMDDITTKQFATAHIVVDSVLRLSAVG